MEQRVGERRRRDRWSRWVQSILLGVVLVWNFIGALADRADDQRVKESVAANQALAHQIQDQRRDNIIAACRAQNRKNAALSGFLEALPPNPGQPVRPKKEQEGLLRGFTDAVAGPVVKDCRRRAEELTR